MSVKLIVIQLELSGIGYKLVFRSYSMSVSNTWYTLICKFEKYKPSPQKLHGYEHIWSIGFKKKREIRKIIKKEIKEIEKQTSFFRILKTKKNGKIGEKKEKYLGQT
jgi:hypothetical protein